MLRRILGSAPFALALAMLVFASPASAGGHKWKHHGEHHGHHHHRDCGHGAYYAPRYVEHWHYREPVVHYVPVPEPYYAGPYGHTVAVVGLPSVIFQASIGGGVGWVFDD